MMDFMDGQYEVLLSTTIIESGLDIPRANTILVNNADQFGLRESWQAEGEPKPEAEAEPAQAEREPKPEEEAGQAQGEAEHATDLKGRFLHLKIGKKMQSTAALAE